MIDFFMDYWHCAAYLLIAACVGALVLLPILYLSTETVITPKPAAEDLRLCAPSRNTRQCFELLGYKVERK